MFFHRCCFLIRDDVSAPAFDSPRSAMSKSSISCVDVHEFLDKEVVFIKKGPAVWYDPEDEQSSCEEESTWHVIASGSSTNKNDNRISSGSCCTRSSSTEDPNKIPAVEKGKRCLSHKNKSSTYLFTPPQTVSACSIATSRILDWVMTCCWKCSPGCQQLPALNV
ncbi:uncharacterized protein [Onthophagus taurus]|uniref:uncharacterized protein n=1 Tax=Onthophagus taurus TaxID=166361 RepID=UPI000C1FDC32|nr:uncharacterized protein LOC111422480 [Onthophagus taurus]